MIYQTFMRYNVLFKLFICVLLFRGYSSAPVNSSETYSSFLEEIIKDGCRFPTEVSLPFSSKDTFEYLARPLQICNASDTTKRTKEAILLCSEVFDTLKNITCHPQATQLPKIEVVFSEDVCSDIKAVNFPNKTESLLKHLNDKIVCDMICDEDYLPVCTVLLWSYQVQKQIEDVKNAPKIEGSEVEKSVVKIASEKQSDEQSKQIKGMLTNEVPEKQPNEEPKQIKVTLTGGNSMQDDKPKITATEGFKNSKQIKLVNDAPPVLQNVEDAKLPKINDDNFKNQNNITPEVSSKGKDLLISTKKQNEPTNNLQQNNQGEISKEIADVKQSFEGENEAKSVNDENVENSGNKSVIASVQGNLSKDKDNNELSQATSAEIITKINESGASKKKELNMSNAQVEPEKNIISPDIINQPSVIQAKVNKEKEHTKPGFPEEKKTRVNLEDIKYQTAAVTSNQKMKELNPKIETKVVTTPDMSSLQSEKPISQLEPTSPKKAEPSKNADVTETGLGELSSLTTIADLEKMEEGNEIPESNNKDQDSYNDIENEGEFSKVDYDGDDGFFEPSKNKQTDESEPAKLPDSISESQSDLSKYPVFPARNSIGQSDDIQVIPQFPEQEDSHFFFYFLSIVLILMAGYLLFHNKQKIIALIVEGRHERRRRSHGVGYKKLDTK